MGGFFSLPKITTGPVGIFPLKVESDWFSGYRDLKGQTDGQTDIILLCIIDYRKVKSIKSEIKEVRQMEKLNKPYSSYCIYVKPFSFALTKMLNY